MGSQIYHNSFDSLIHKDPTRVEPAFLPGLAVSWQMIAPTCMELQLRRDVTFHNGDPMTADDVVFSLMRMFNPSYPPYVIRQREYFMNMYKAEKVDEYTVRVFTKRPDPLFEILLAVQQANILPKKYLMGLSGHAEVDEVTDYEKFGLAPVGTGPYKITEWRPGERIVWERFEAFWGDQPAVKKITVRRIPELAARLTGLITGELDLITNLSPDQVATVEKGQNTKVVGALTPIFHVVFYNTEHPKMTRRSARPSIWRSTASFSSRACGRGRLRSRRTTLSRSMARSMIRAFRTCSMIPSVPNSSSRRRDITALRSPLTPIPPITPTACSRRRPSRKCGRGSASKFACVSMNAGLALILT